MGWGDGKATATLFAREGARVAVIDIDLAAATETVSIIEREGGEALALQADVTDAGAVERAVQKTLDQWGRIDVLHNNVGIHRHESMSSISLGWANLGTSPMRLCSLPRTRRNTSPERNWWWTEV
jgi:NAD(P)-dependent dehydrogenase (short-subunit alcohol dehydrogenase family)